VPEVCGCSLAVGRHQSLARRPVRAGAIASGACLLQHRGLNPFGDQGDENRQVAYEKAYRHFKDLAQRRIVGVRIRGRLCRSA